MDPTKLPAWLRITLVVGIVVLIAGASLLGWRWHAKPTSAGEEDSRDVTALNVAAHRLENLIHDRRLAFAQRGGGVIRSGLASAFALRATADKSLAPE